MSRVPRVSIGLPVYNGERYIRSALDSLLAQTFADFELTISDNASTDATLRICSEYAAADTRISLDGNAHNRGMVQNFRDVFGRARGTYFMWASDHDLWHPDWLQTHVRELDAHPGVVLVYPRVIAIDADGRELFKEPRRFDTFGMGKLERIRAGCTRMVGAGNMVYGLFRASALANTSVYPFWAMPDRLLLMELSVLGGFRQIERYLWYRRYPAGMPSISGVPPNYEQIIERQRRNLFSGGKAPWHSRFPTLGHALGLVYYLSLRPPSGTYVNAHLGPYMALKYLHRRRHVVKEEIRLLARRVTGRARGV